MRLCVLGATGPLGQCVIRAAMKDGHDVLALVRDPTRLPADIREHSAFKHAEVDK
jgi:uncharacterized protein YbjT (DUF2867 family)